ncbi:MAG: A/G-specific adenine glycosylase [Bdellovibrionales bacterium RIFCSPHIGHO2_01_FULL_40_29]|nr:MAG: A/G-specific adenine glycosylase [Bdellovibrionales bacterium RIFCSPHIGHO2_01_FULL_40_29]OFZ35378.1 MAG: A/G-specific adenine glycosylase [Bdellovibrionales bacterium RIFCSPHIGHO2_02_FULL_40_15]
MAKTTVLNVLKYQHQDQSDLLHWYRQNRRVLPWRAHKDPYKIWISEVMLQQTTVVAVIPFYEKFLRRFPTVHSLAKASENEVLEHWAGLGYYSRARNLHKAAKHLSVSGFYRTAEQLLELPGFGPYTSRAVASLAFDEPVGVLDGNVIRILSRRFGLKVEWWNNKEKLSLQKIADQLANTPDNSDINQGMMELGATVCTPKKPLCLLCPWKVRCLALKTDQVQALPLSKPRAATEIWQWTLHPQIKGSKIFLTPLSTAPFLKNVLFPVSTVEKLKKKPKNFHIKHSVTKYSLYIKIEKSKPETRHPGQWVNLNEIKKMNPSSLMTKILKFSKNNETIKS